MTAVTKLGLSGSTDGRPIKITDTSFAPGTLLHTATSTSGDFDEVWLWAVNTSTSPVNIAIGWGATSTPAQIQIVVPPESGLVPVIPGLILAGGLVIRAAAASGNVVNIVGYVNRCDADGTPSSVFNKNDPSASTTGLAVAVAATSTPGTTIHTATSSTETDEWDEIWLWAYGDSSSAVKLTVEFGGMTSPDDLIEVTIPALGAGLTLVIPGLILHNSLVLSAFAASGGDVNLIGYVNEITTP